MTATVGFRSVIKNGPTVDQMGYVELVQFETGIDPTQSTAATNMVLPKGAIVMDVVNLSGDATGGTNPTVDVGTESNPDAFADELAADAVASALADGTNGADFGSALTSAETVYVGVGASAATGGTVDIAVRYVIDPSNAIDPSGV